jgi:uncharacterized protein YkwD
LSSIIAVQSACLTFSSYFHAAWLLRLQPPHSSMRSARFAIAALLVVSSAASTPRAENAEPSSAWLERVNFYRAMAALPPVVEEPALSATVTQHARYMVAHDVIPHSQNRGRSWSTPEGAAAAVVSNLIGSMSPTESDFWAVDVWMQAPFHAIGILDPALQQVGFGIYRAPDGKKIQTAAGLDVIRGRSSQPADVSYPIVWPADGTSVPLGTHTTEYPSPLTSCAGYKAPTGLPLIVQMGPGANVPRVAHSAISDGTRWLHHCVFDESTYRNRNSAQERLGRSILAARDAIVLIPREPLTFGSRYRVQVEVDGQQINWTFEVGQLSS